jgi:hypothetical protein
MRFVFKAEKPDLRQDQIRAFSAAIIQNRIRFILFFFVESFCIAYAPQK